ncbi:hydroxymethylbilane synthase [Jonquetella anthropi]|uniref:hydroxymethylbilane synthase n=1 Tax=Jonquetella anthropi TaxID=428712 RepID=UPI0001B911BB|nr:hydroxymethylbilane synthase [Jonquetella anthropi]EEX49238.1 hydroxymethylbilane synthase [Jonquetella anthropi E3_33 E1]
MRRIWLIGGTSDAKNLADILVAEGFSLLATVATPEGLSFWGERPGLEVRAGRLDEAAMEGLLAQEKFLAVVDGSHPYAQQVTACAREASRRAGVPFFRLGRAATPLPAGAKVFPTAALAAEFLANTSGKIFLTVGSKELEPFAALRGAGERLTVRILPALASLEKCFALGLGPANVIAMTGPFSQATNELQLKESGAAWLVTKDGGAAGGAPEKFAAAEALGVGLVVISRPLEGDEAVDAGRIVQSLKNITGGELTAPAREDVPEQKALVPLFFDLNDGFVLLAGGGPVAARRARALLSCGVRVLMVAPELCAASKQLSGRDGFTWCARQWQESDCHGATVVLAATDDPSINGRIVQTARRLGIPVNRADSRQGNDFVFPAVVRLGSDVAALSTSSLSPARTAKLAARLRAAWPQMCRDVPLGRPLRLASRESELAMAQSRLVAERLHEATGFDVEIIPFRTRGDAVADRRLESAGGKGLFVKELERAILSGQADLAVHSLKDMPSSCPDGLAFAALMDRQTAFDCLVLRPGLTGRPVRIGTSSARRIAQGRALFSDAQFVPLRGNLRTRLSKLDGGEFDALILAEAGLRRLGLQERVSRVFSADQMIPSAGQGTLAVQCPFDGPVFDLVSQLDEPAVRTCCLAERAFIDRLNGGCTAPHGAYARVDGETIEMIGLYVRPDGKTLSGKISGPAADGPSLAAELADRLKRRGDGL